MQETIREYKSSAKPATGSRDLLEEIKSRLDLVMVAQELYPELKKTGNIYQGSHGGVHSSQNGRCLTVWPSSASWKCFNCGRGGDAFELIGIARYGLNYSGRGQQFRAVLEEAASRAGLDLRPLSEEEKLRAAEQSRLYGLLTEAARWFYGQLAVFPQIQEHLTRNYGLTGEFLEQKAIGFAPPDTGALPEYLQSLGYTLEEMKAASIVNKGGRCRYQGRIMFPFWQQGQVVYFAARVTELTPTSEFETLPGGGYKKYRKLKTRDEDNLQIAEYIQSDVLLGIDNLSLARQKGYLLITEGIPDQLAAEQAGEPCLSPTTTHFTGKQLEGLVKLAQSLKVYLCFDNERGLAGENGAIDTARTLEQKGLKTYLIRLPRPTGVEKIDLCEYLRDSGPEALAGLYRAALRLPDYLTAYRPVPQNDEDKAEFIGELAYLAAVTCRYDRVCTNSLQQKLATATAVPLGIIREIFRDKVAGTGASDSVAGAPRSFGNREKKSQATQLVELCGEFELFHNRAFQAYVSFGVEDHFETWPVKSSHFKQTLRQLYFRAYQDVPRKQSLEDALALLEALAIEGPRQEVHFHLAFHEGSIYLDLATESWEVVKISPAGWEVLAHSPVKFRRGAGSLPLPYPKPGGKLSDLQQFTNLNPADWKLLAAWLVTAFNPHCQYPVLTISGEQGSAKSTASRFIRRLLDPSLTLLRTAPKDERDFWISSQNSWVLAYDNLSDIPNWLSDTFCRVASGGGNVTRKLYSDDEEIFFEARRPVLLNGIGTIATRGDLLERSLIINLPAILESERRSENEVTEAFEEALPGIFGGLLDAVSLALARLSSVNLSRLPRMADFARWAVAAEPAFGGIAEVSFLEAYGTNRDEIHELALEASPLGRLFMRRFEDLVPGGEHWLGTAGQLLEELAGLLTEEERRAAVRAYWWPKNERGLRVQLERLAPSLRAAGYILDFEVYAGGIKRGIRVGRKISEDRMAGVEVQTEEFTRFQPELTPGYEFEGGQNLEVNSGINRELIGELLAEAWIDPWQEVHSEGHGYASISEEDEACAPGGETELLAQNGGSDTPGTQIFKTLKNFGESEVAITEIESTGATSSAPTENTDMAQEPEPDYVEIEFSKAIETAAGDYQELLRIKGKLEEAGLKPEICSRLRAKIRDKIAGLLKPGRDC